MGLTLLTPPADEPVSLAEAKLHLRVDHDAEDTLIASLVQAAREWVEGETRRALITQAWRLTLDALADEPYAHGREQDAWATGAVLCRPLCDVLPRALWTHRAIHLPRPNLQSVTTIQYVDGAGVTQTWDPSQYVVDASALPGRVRLAYGASWPAVRCQPTAVTIDFVAGYGDSPEDVPASLRAAILLVLGDLYVNREAQIVGVTVARNPTVDRLLGPYLYREAV